MYGSSAFTLVFDSQNSKPSSAVDIRATPERISWGTSEIETKYVFGVQHVVPNAGKCSSGLCKDPSLVQAQALISQAPTGYFMVFGYTITRKNGVFLEPVLRLLKFRQNEFADTPSEMLVIDAVKQLSILVSAANPLAIPKQILFILNPKSGGGNGKSVKIYNEVVSPMLAIAGIEASSELFKTTSPESAVEKIKGLNIANYWCLVALSGDGGFHEIVDALLQRPDWSEASKLAIGTIPAGNGLFTKELRMQYLSILMCQLLNMRCLQFSREIPKELTHFLLFRMARLATRIFL